MGKVFEEIMAENFPSLMKEMHINIQEDQQTLSEMNSEIHTETHENQTFNKQRENLESRKREGTHYIQGILNKMNRFLSRNFSSWNIPSVKINKLSTKKPISGNTIFQKWGGNQGICTHTHKTFTDKQQLNKFLATWPILQNAKGSPAG